jgi:hypothetical protein
MSDVLIKLTGLWERDRRGNPGNVYWTGRLGAAKILVFRNNRKEGPDDPDFNVFITEPSPPRQERPAQQAERGVATGAVLEQRAREWSPAERHRHEQALDDPFDARPPDEIPF